ncbi:MAG TPA: M28 family peptidase [Gemmatimonadaceae bacterium]
MSKHAFRALALCLIAAETVNGQAKLNKYGYPEKHAPQPTSQAITAGDLMTRLYIFADDSMQGQQFGRVGNMKGTNYIANEVKRLGLVPAGDNGTFFQRLPMELRHFTEKSTMTVDGATLKFNTDFVPTPTPRAPKPIQNAQVIFGGTAGDTANMISADQAAGKFVILLPAPNAAGGRGGRGGGGGGGGGGGAGNFCAAVLNPGAGNPAAGGGGRGGFGGFGGANPAARFPNAVAVATINLDAIPVGDRGFINMPTATPLPIPPREPQPVVVIRDGQVATLRNGQVVSGSLPSGMTAAQIQAAMDSIRTDSVSRMGRTALSDALERVHACAVEDSIAVSHGATSMMGAGGLAAAEDAARQGVGGRGGRGGGGGGGGGGRGGRGAVDPNAPAPTVSMSITKAAAEKLLGRSAEGMAPGTAGKTVTGNLDFEAKDASDWARNVVAIIPGSDPKLKGQYVLVSAHNDHVGFSTQAVDHDSLKMFNDLRNALSISKRPGDLVPNTTEELADIVAKINVDSLHKIRPARKDSINNGADDDGSGSMGILEIAEYIAKMPVKPKRSTIFVWQTGEEAGLNGSAYFATHPTVPVDSIVADINIDMIGRGRAEDVPMGGPLYTFVVGADFLSKDLAQVVSSTNLKEKQPITLDPKLNFPTVWPGYNNIYGRSDHFNYARQCIPIAFFFTGLHGDYHQRTDEPQYIDYPHYAAVDNYIKDVVLELANRAQRPSLDKPCTRAQ